VVGRRVPPERVRLVLDHLAAGLRPYLLARAAGVSVTFAYGLHHKMGGVYGPPGFRVRRARRPAARPHQVSIVPHFVPDSRARGKER
jgi:hypothetical protein